MRVAIPKETLPEKRVALVPHLTNELIQLGCTPLLEKGAGLGAFYADTLYQSVEFCDDAASLYQQADIILKVCPPLEDDISLYKTNSIVIGLLAPNQNPKCILEMRDHKITSFAMEFIPRISRAQSLDVLSSQATIAGYKSVLLAANLSNRIFPMFTTAAGTLRPANVLVIGAGVAGLQAIATARRLGAIVKAYDIRSAAKEQVESLGAKMINIEVKGETTGGYARELTEAEIQQQQSVLQDAVAKSDVVITTALVPGRTAPNIITRAMVELMQPGSVIIDIAAESGGNCELTVADKIIIYNDVMIHGPINLPSMVARDASNMFAKNFINFIKLLFKDRKLAIDWEDPILSQSVLTHNGDIKHPVIRKLTEGVN